MMDFSNPEGKALDADVEITAYLKAPPLIQSVVSSILTAEPESASFMYAYILNKNAEKISNLHGGDLGFTVFSGQKEFMFFLIKNIYDDLSSEHMTPIGKDIQHEFISQALRSMSASERIAVIDAAR